MTERLWEIVLGGRNGVLATIRADGMPQLSNIYYLADRSSQTIRVSTTTVRAKGRHLQRESTSGVVRTRERLREVRGCGRPRVTCHRRATW